MTPRALRGTSAARSFPPTRLSVGLAARFVSAWLSLEVGDEDPRHPSLLAHAETAERAGGAPRLPERLRDLDSLSSQWGIDLDREGQTTPVVRLTGLGAARRVQGPIERHSRLRSSAT